MIRLLLLLSLLLAQVRPAVSPPRVPVLGQEEIEGVFPQMGTGASEVAGEGTAAALRRAMDAANVDSHPGLTLLELRSVFNRCDDSIVRSPRFSLKF